MLLTTADHNQSPQKYGTGPGSNSRLLDLQSDSKATGPGNMCITNILQSSGDEQFRFVNKIDIEVWDDKASSK